MTPQKFVAYLAVVVSPAVVALMADRMGLDEVSAMRKFVCSSVYAALSDEGTKMWHYSPELICSLVDEEERTGKFTYPEEAL